MEQTYQIEWLEAKHIAALNKEKYSLTLRDAQDAVLNDITMWSDFPDFSNFKPGSTVTGALYTKTNDKGYTSTTIYPPKPKVAPQGSFAPKASGFKAGMAKMVEQKQAGIEKSQSRKEDGIQISSTFRDATILTNAELNGKTDQEIKDIWLKWRTWLLSNWDVDERDLKSPF